MARARKAADGTADDAFRLVDPATSAKDHADDVHVYGRKVKCVTDTRGLATPRGDPRSSLVVDASEGHVPLWKKGCTLRWRFQRRTLARFADPVKAAAAIRDTMAQALLAWGDAVPIRFAERDDAWDFEVSVRNADDCDATGCTLASSFFPDAGRHELTIYPEMLKEPKAAQVATLEHEFGHVFGLRHFFAALEEKKWPSKIFGTHKPFTIMNYGSKSVLTATDRSDLKALYAKVWSGELTDINGTPIRLVQPFHNG